MEKFVYISWCLQSSYLWEILKPTRIQGSKENTIILAEDYPARSTLQAAALPKNAMVEIEMTASKAQRSSFPGEDEVQRHLF